MDMKEKHSFITSTQKHVNPDEAKYYINADYFLFYMKASNECWRELAVSISPMLPYIQKNSVDFDLADYILYEHEYAQDMDMSGIVLSDLRYIAKIRKPNAEIIVVGKSANVEKLLKPNEISNITFWGDHYAEKFGKKFGFSCTDDPFVLDTKGRLNIWPVNGCMRKCGFCRRTYMDIKFESLPLEEIKLRLDYLKENHPELLQKISLRAENLTEYGIDLYGEQRLQDILNLLNSYIEIKQIEMPIGMAICEITPAILEAICRCKKITHIGLNVETGSNRLLKLINKPHTIENAIEIYSTIRKAIPNIYFDCTAMVGLPTETLVDIEGLAKFFEIAQPDWVTLMYYGLAPGHPLAKLPQLSQGLRKYHQHFLLRLLRQQFKSGKRTKPIQIRYAKSRKPGSRKTVRMQRRFDFFKKTYGPLLQNYVIEYI